MPIFFLIYKITSIISSDGTLLHCAVAAAELKSQNTQLLFLWIHCCCCHPHRSDNRLLLLLRTAAITDQSWPMVT